MGLRRCWSEPVRVRRKMLPRFSNVHMVVLVVDDALFFVIFGVDHTL